MNHPSLKFFRILIPGVFVYSIAFVFGLTTNWFSISFPTDLKEITKSVACIFIGALYTITNAREVSNYRYYTEVNQHIIDCLVNGIPSLRGTKLDWAKVRPVLYSIVDNDKSLSIQSKLILFNGLLWTSAADARAIAALLAPLFPGAVILSALNPDIPMVHESKTIYAFLVLLAIFTASLWVSRVITNRHKKLCENQCSQILLHYKQKAEDGLLSALKGVNSL